MGEGEAFYAETSVAVIVILTNFYSLRLVPHADYSHFCRSVAVVM